MIKEINQKNQFEHFDELNPKDNERITNDNKNEIIRDFIKENQENLYEIKESVEGLENYFEFLKELDSKLLEALQKKEILEDDI